MVLSSNSNAGSRGHQSGAAGNDTINNNTFLSRVFGMNSSFPTNSPLFTDDQDTELSLYHDRNSMSNSGGLHSDEEEFFNGSHEGPTDDYDDSDSEEHENGNAADESESENDDEIQDYLNPPSDDDEEAELIPESLMVENRLSDKGKYPVKSILMNPGNGRGTPSNSSSNNPGNNVKHLQDISQKAKDIASKTFFNIKNNVATGSSDGVGPTSLPHPLSMNFKFQRQQKKEEKTLRNKLGILTPLEKSLWVWLNITNLDIFLSDVYKYYYGKGFQCMVIETVCDILTLVFILFLSMFMGNCIDYDVLLHENPTQFGQVKVDKCFSKIPTNQKFLIFVISVFIVLRIKSFFLKELPKLREIQNFYKYLLKVTDEELQTISWNSIVTKIMVLRNQNTNLIISENFDMINDDLKSKKRLNAHDIANRIMRKENYMIAMFNKNILNLSLPGSRHLNAHTFLTKTLEWNLNLCIFDFVFDSKTGQLQKKFLKEQNRIQLSKELKNRFILAGILNIILSPFVVTYFIVYYFLKFFYEFRYNPNLINNREYTPLLMWKFREFNELEHLFKKRLNLSNEILSNYINQFPRKKIDLVLKFFSFISGSLLTILVILTIFDPESFLNFEITNQKTVLFYISTLGAIYTICQNSIHDENVVFDPEQKLHNLYRFTHYMPKEWEGKLHSEDIKFEFAKFYDLKIMIILKELMSLIFLPIILCYSLPRSCTKIIDFFREFTVHVDELGYVCHFAMFNFEKKDRLRSEYYQSNDDKMMKSYLYFIENINNDENIESSHFDMALYKQPPQAPAHNLSSNNPNFSRRRPVSKLRNSYILEESFDNVFTDTKVTLPQSSTAKSLNGNQINSPVDEFDDEEDGEDDGGVLKFVNQFYNKR